MAIIAEQGSVNIAAVDRFIKANPTSSHLKAAKTMLETLKAELVELNQLTEARLQALRKATAA